MGVHDFRAKGMDFPKGLLRKHSVVRNEKPLLTKGLEDEHVCGVLIVRFCPLQTVVLVATTASRPVGNTI